MITIGLPIVKTKFLRQAIESILNQSYKDFELIVLNNGKTNENKEEIKKIVNSYNDIRIKYYENRKQIPVIENWNLCVKYSSSNYFVLFSDDDIYEVGFLDSMVRLINKFPNLDLFHARVMRIDDNGNKIATSNKISEYESPIEFIWKRLVKNRIQFVPEFLFRKSKLLEVGGFYNLPYAWGSDDITCFLLSYPNGVAGTNELLCNMRYSKFNLSNTSNFNDRLKAIEDYEVWLKEFLYRIEPTSKKERRYYLEIKNNLGKIFHKRKLSLLEKEYSSANFWKYFWLLTSSYSELELTPSLQLKLLAKKLLKKQV